jgi:uncharacterized small protein (DUF1192 family)
MEDTRRIDEKIALLLEEIERLEALKIKSCVCKLHSIYRDD